MTGTAGAHRRTNDDATRQEIVTFGESMALLRSEEDGPLSPGDRFRLGFGGAESNVAIALRRLGLRSRWVGRVGSDEFGTLIAGGLRAEGVDAVVIVDAHAPTGVMLKHHAIGGRTVVSYRRTGSAGSKVRPDDVLPWIDTARLLHVTGITPALSQTARDATVRAVRRAADLGCDVSLDVNYRAALWSKGDAGAVLRELLPYTAVLFADRLEASVLTGPGHEALSDADLLDQLTLLGPKEVVLKQGADGALASVDGVLLDVEAVPVQVVDTVGAGDAFVAAYLAERLADAPAEQRLRSAALAGALACTVSGDWEAAPSRADLSIADHSDPVIR